MGDKVIFLRDKLGTLNIVAKLTTVLSQVLLLLFTFKHALFEDSCGSKSVGLNVVIVRWRISLTFCAAIAAEVNCCKTVAHSPTEMQTPRLFLERTLECYNNCVNVLPSCITDTPKYSSVSCCLQSARRILMTQSHSISAHPEKCIQWELGVGVGQHALWNF